MNWVEEFYARQDEWYGIYSGEVNDYYREQAARIEKYAGSGAKQVLELGAAGGQAAAATADLGYNITAIELVPKATAHAQKFAAQPRNGKMTVIQGDFYKVELEERFDVVCYWDGFGIGEDEDQQRLLKRIANWLKPGGCALIDVCTPWYWAKVAGRGSDLGAVSRRYDFEAEQCRMLDQWWPKDNEQTSVTQSLRCYSPADLRLLLRNTGLMLDKVEPGGAVDYEAHKYLPKVPLGQAMQYTAKLISGAERGN